MILTHLQKLPSNVGDLGKIIGATGFEWLPKVQKSTNLVTLNLMLILITFLQYFPLEMPHCFSYLGLNGPFRPIMKVVLLVEILFDIHYLGSFSTFSFFLSLSFFLRKKRNVCCRRRGGRKSDMMGGIKQELSWKGFMTQALEQTVAEILFKAKYQPTPLPCGVGLCVVITLVL